MISFPPCKINLGLNVISKRPDGYHEIETCFYPVPWTDILEILPSDVLTFTNSGNSIPGKNDDNLCLRAYQLLKSDFNLAPVKIHLHKIIPTGAGLGGGSSNAAFTLRLLNTIFNLGLNVNQLRTYAAQLGSDCAFFMEDKPMIGSGRGEVLREAKLKLEEKFIVIVKPTVHISTEEAYRGVKSVFKIVDIKDLIARATFESWKNLLVNDFEESVFEMHPLIQEIKNKLYGHGAFYASMSGSGSAIYGIFDEPVKLKDHFPAMTYWSGVLN